MLPWLAHCVSPFCLGRLGRLSLRACCSSFSRFRLAEDMIVLGDASWKLGLSLLILECFFPLGVGLGLCMKWVRAAEFFGPTIAPQNPAVRLLKRKGGFWCPQALVMAFQVLTTVSVRAFSFAKGTFLALRYMGCVLIKLWRLCAPYIRRCDGNPTVGISLAFMGGKIHAVILIGGINTHSKQSVSLLLPARVLVHIPWIRSSVQPNLRLLST